MNEQKCCTRQSLRRMVCSVLPVQVSRARAPTPNTSLTGSSKRKARVLHKHPNLDFSMRIPKWVSAELETAVLNLSRGPDSDYRLEPTQAAGQHPRIRTPDGQHHRTGTCRSCGIITRPGLDGPTRSERCFSKQVATDTLRRDEPSRVPQRDQHFSYKAQSVRDACCHWAQGEQQRTHQTSTDGSGTHDSEAPRLRTHGRGLTGRPTVPPTTRQSSQHTSAAVLRG